MKIVIGLGNPGEEYESTRHNAGRDVVIAFAKKAGFPNFEDDKNTFSLLARGKVDGNKILLALPQTFMNKSGKAADALKVKAKDALVIHDDSDILLGRMKFSFGKSSAGHKGIESVMRALKTKDFWRLRIGIQKKKRVDAENLVLMKFTPQEKKIFSKVLKTASNAVETFLTESPEKAMSTYNK